MSNTLEQTKAVLVVFAMHGCPACEDYIPRLIGQVEGFQKMGHPFVFYTNGQLLREGQLPILILDSMTRDASIQAFADQHGIQNLPTTILMTKSTGTAKKEGALDDKEVYELLVAMVNYNR